MHLRMRTDVSNGAIQGRRKGREGARATVRGRSERKRSSQRVCMCSVSPSRPASQHTTFTLPSLSANVLLVQVSRVCVNREPGSRHHARPNYLSYGVSLGANKYLDQLSSHAGTSRNVYVRAITDDNERCQTATRKTGNLTDAQILG